MKGNPQLRAQDETTKEKWFSKHKVSVYFFVFFLSQNVEL